MDKFKKLPREEAIDGLPTGEQVDGLPGADDVEGHTAGPDELGNAPARHRRRLPAAVRRRRADR